jgi:cytoskeletal protein RodZ
LPAKHTARPLGPARIFLSAAAAVLVMLVIWIAVRAVGPAEAARQPTVALPSMPQVPLSPSLTASGAAALPPATSATPSSASPARSPLRSSTRPTATSHSPSPTSSHWPERATTPKPTATKTTRAPSADFAVTVSVGASWEQGYVASVRLQNTGNATGSWTVTVSHANLSNLRLLGTWGGARGTQAGNNVVFTGGPLPAGASAGFGYQVSKSGSGNARPSGCSVVGGRCGVS